MIYPYKHEAKNMIIVRIPSHQTIDAALQYVKKNIKNELVWLVDIL